AYHLIGSEKVRAALDIQRERPALRDSYGMTVFGQACLAARRLVEAGSKFVTVFWDEYGLAGSAWDTHWEHYPRLKNELLPGLATVYHLLGIDPETTLTDRTGRPLPLVAGSVLADVLA